MTGSSVRLGDAAPVALWVTGQSGLRFSCLRSVAVTGARASTAYGSYLASQLGASLAGRGWTVISGASFGVDAAAHRGALAADGVTIAVTAGGPDMPTRPRTPTCLMRSPGRARSSARHRPGC
jgi:DNA processing protein